MKIKPLQRQKMSRMQYIENYKILSYTLDKMQPSIRWDVAYQTDTLVFKITFKKKYNEKYKKKTIKSMHTTLAIAAQEQQTQGLS